MTTRAHETRVGQRRAPEAPASVPAPASARAAARAHVPTTDALFSAPFGGQTGVTIDASAGGAAAPPLTRVGPYRLLGELGRGGMGVVYEAEHELLGRRVALKTLGPEAHGDALHDRRARFLDEARTAARLRHPAVVTVHDAGQADGHLFLVMDLIRGETLAERLERRGALAPEAACALLLPIVDALAAAHRARIVHRDVKPDNVLLEAGAPGAAAPNAGADRALLADFGLACDLFRGGERSPAGRPMGTLSHMAPEQLRGEAVGPACDVWGLGVTLYECLTDRLPWDVGETERLEDFARAQATTDPLPPRALAPDVSPALEQVVLRCLARRPEDRFADAGALLAALEAARPWRAPRRPLTRQVAALRGRVVAAVGLAAGLIAGAAATHAVARLISAERAERRDRPELEVPHDAPGARPGAPDPAT